MPRIKNKKNYNQKSSQRGAVLLFSILILAIMMSIMFTVLGVIIPKLKLSTEPIKSAMAITAADSGLEWCLYINRGKPRPQPLPSPTFQNGASVIVYYPASGFVLATCDPAETPVNHRSVGSFGSVARSFEVSVPQCSDGLDNDLDLAQDFPADPQCISPNDNDESI